MLPLYVLEPLSIASRLQGRTLQIGSQKDTATLVVVFVSVELCNVMIRSRMFSQLEIEIIDDFATMGT